MKIDCKIPVSLEIKESSIYILPLFYLFVMYTTIHCSKPKSNPLLDLILHEVPLIDLYFSYPGRNSIPEKKHEVKQKLIQEIRKSKHSIRAYLYSFNDYEIISELKLKQNAGIKIELFGDKDTNYDECKKKGLAIEIWTGSGIHHTKIWFFDEKVVFMGTGNYTTHGLERDHNVYWKHSISKEEFKNFTKELSGQSEKGIVYVRNLNYLISPNSGKLIQDDLIEEINSAKNSIQYLIFSHFDPLVSWALLNAANRGVRVEGVYNVPTNDESIYLANHLPYPSVIYEEGNSDVLVENGAFYGGLLHHKTMIIDEKKVLVGSYNYSVSARDKNLEFFTTFENEIIVKEFLLEFQRIKTYATPILPKQFPNPEYNKYFLIQFSNPILSSFGLFRTGGGLDSNSSGLSREFFSSLGDTGINFQEALEGRFLPIQTFPHDYLINFNSLSEALVLKDLFTEVEVLLPNEETILKIEVWDGKSSKKTFNQLSFGRFSTELLTELKNFRWIYIFTDKSQYNYCSFKKGVTIPDWIQYLRRKIYWNTKVWLSCLVL